MAENLHQPNGRDACLNATKPHTRPMDLDEFKGKTLDEALFTKLSDLFVTTTARAETAEGKARAAVRESIDGRKQLKAERDAAFEKLGVSTHEELEALPAPQGQADALKQLQAQLKRAERERGEAVAARDEISGKYTADRRALAIERALGAHPFVDADDARSIFGARVKSDGDDLLFETPDGKLVPLADGAAWMAKTKPHLVKAPAGTGSGFKPTSQATGAAANPGNGMPTLDLSAIYAARNPTAPTASATGT